MLKRCFIVLFIHFLIIDVNGQLSKVEQHQVDSLNNIINSTVSHDTSLASAYVELSGILYVSNLDTMIPLCTKAKEIVEKALQTGPPTLTANSLRTSLAEALNNMGYVYGEKGDIPKQTEYYHKSLKIREELGNKKGMATTLNNIGYMHQQQGDVKLALEYNNRSFKLYQELGDKSGMASSLINIGYIHNKKGDVPLAIEYYNKSLKLYEELGDKIGVAKSLNNIGYIHQQQGDIKVALEYYSESLKIREKLDDKIGMASSLINIGTIHNDQNDIPIALKCFQKSFKLLEELGNKRGMAYSLNNIGTIYKQQGDILLALEYYHQSLKFREELGDKIGVAKSLNNIGALELGQGALTNAEIHLRRGLKLAQEVGAPGDISISTNQLSRLAKQQGKYKEALKMFELHIQMRDSIKNEETQKASIRQATKYEFEKAQLVKEQEEKEIARLEQEQTQRRDNLQYSIILVGILAVFGLVLSLGFISISQKLAEGLIFFAFLIFFEFILVLGDPYVENWTGGAPGLKLLVNAGVAALIFPLHAFFESRLKGRLVKTRSV